MGLKGWIGKGLIGLLVLVGVSSTVSHNTATPTPKVKSLQTEITLPSEAPTATLEPTLKPTSTPKPIPTATSSNTSGNSGYYKNVDGNKVQSPTYYNSAPAGATAKCKDGTYSFSQHRSGTCSHHGGVAQWL